MAIRILAAAFTFFTLTLLFFIAPAAGLFVTHRDVVASEWDPFKPLDLTAPDSFVQQWKIRAERADAELCRRALSAAKIPARPRADRVDGPHCSLIDTVALSGLGRMSLKAIDTRCSVAMSLYLWERRTVQPAAQHFFGEPVARLLHFGSYSCRRIEGRSIWSQHALGNAVDVAGFQLKSGKVVSVLKDWPQHTDASRFLRVVREGACDHFNMVLGPDYNAAHADHFHFDHGFWRGCR